MRATSLLVPTPVVRKRIAIVFHRIGPYHRARIKAAARRFETLAVEAVSIDRTYRWDRIGDLSGVNHVVVAATDEDLERNRAKARGVLREALDSFQPDVVAVPGWYGVETIGTWLWAVRRGVPVIVMSESTQWDSRRTPLREAVKGRLLRTAAAALVGGRANAAYLHSLGMREERVFTGYDVVDNDHFWGTTSRKAGRLRERPAAFLAAGRFVEKKNFETLLVAYARYREQATREAWDLRIAGDGEGRGRLERLSGELAIDDGVRFLGFRQYDELPGFYRSGRVFVHPSRVEQWGLVVNEAMAAGLPVLVSNRCGCAADLVEEGSNGYSFDPENVEELASRLRELAEGASDLDRFGKRSLTIIEGWRPERFAEGLSAAYAAAVIARGRSIDPAARLLLAVLERSRL